MYDQPIEVRLCLDCATYVLPMLRSTPRVDVRLEAQLMECVAQILDACPSCGSAADLVRSNTSTSRVHQRRSYWGL